MPIQVVLFDIGGVLEVTPRTDWRDGWAARFGLAPAAFEERVGAICEPGSVGAASLEELERQTADAFGLDNAEVSELMGDAWTEYLGTLNYELARYFAGLRPRVRTGIVSNSFVGAREREQKLYGFEDMCDVIIYSHEVGWMKPDPRIYHAACDRFGCAPQEAVLLDDLPANVDGARAVGMHAVLFTDTAQAIADLEALLA